MRLLNKKRTVGWWVLEKACKRKTDEVRREF